MIRLRPTGSRWSPRGLGWLLLLPLTATAADAPLWLEVQAEPLTPYVQAQVRYRVRLYYTVPLLEGTLVGPEPDDALSERLGPDQDSVTVRAGRSYRVIERRYAIFPEKSGPLRIPPMRFRGRIRNDEAGATAGGSLAPTGRTVELVSESIMLQVRPRPPGFSGGTWLPATEVQLQALWPDNIATLRVGEPVTWILSVQARGLIATQLPTLPLPAATAFRFYPDPPVDRNDIDGLWLVGRREQRIALIPTVPGELSLPELRLPWWDTQQDREQVAVLPARTLVVLPAPGPVLPAPVPPPATTAASATGFWPMVSALLLGLWLLTLVAWWRSRRRQSLLTVPSSPPLPLASPPRRALRQACQANDAVAAMRALLAWAALEWPDAPPRNLQALAQRLGAAAAPVRQLERVCYGPTPRPWDGGALWQAVQQGLTTAPVQLVAPPNDWPPLYPSGRSEEYSGR